MINLPEKLNVRLVESIGFTVEHSNTVMVSLESKLLDINFHINHLDNSLTVNVFDRGVDTHTDFLKAVIGQLINNHKAGENFKIIELNSAAKLGKGDIMLYTFTSKLS